MIETDKYLIYESWIGPAKDQKIEVGIAYTPIIKTVLRKQDQIIFYLNEIVKLPIIAKKDWYPDYWKIASFEIQKDCDDIQVWFNCKNGTLSQVWFPLSGIVKLYTLKNFL